MSRRSQQFARIAASGPVVEVPRSSGLTGSVRVRVGKHREDFAQALPANMGSEKRNRTVSRFFPKP
jgi:hypothetical protein